MSNLGVYFLKTSSISQASGLVTQQRSDALMVFNGASIMGESGDPVHYQVPDLVTGRLSGIRRSGYENTGMRLEVTEHGMGVRVGNTSGGLQFGGGFDRNKGVITAHPRGSNALTVVWMGKFGTLSSSSGYRPLLSRWYDSNATYRGLWGLRIAASTSRTLQFVYNGPDGLVAYNFNTQAVANDFVCIAVVVDGSKIRGYINGALDFESDITLITTDPDAISGTNQNYRIASDSWSYNGLTGCIHLFAGVYDSAFSHEEAIKASNSPWHLLQNHPKQPIQFFTTPSGKVIPYLSGLITTNITSSGARHSLTLTY